MAERIYTRGNRRPERQSLGLGEAFRRASPGNNSCIPQPTGRSTPSLDSESDAGSLRGSPSPAPNYNPSERIKRAIAQPPRYFGRKKSDEMDANANGSPASPRINGTGAGTRMTNGTSVFAQGRRTLNPRTVETTRTLPRKTSATSNPPAVLEEQGDIADVPLNLTKQWKQEADAHILDPPVHVPKQWGQRAKKASSVQWMKKILSPDPTLEMDFGMDLDVKDFNLRGGYGYGNEGSDESLLNMEDISSHSLPDMLPSRFASEEGPRYPLKDRDLNREERERVSVDVEIPEARTRPENTSRMAKAQLEEMDFDVSQTLPPPKETESEARRRRARESRKARESAAQEKDEEVEVELPKKETIIDTNSAAEKRRERRAALCLEKPREREPSEEPESRIPRRRERAKESETNESSREEAKDSGAEINSRRQRAMDSIAARRERRKGLDSKRGGAREPGSQIPRLWQKDDDSDVSRERVNGRVSVTPSRRGKSRETDSDIAKREPPKDQEADIPRSTTPEDEPNVAILEQKTQEPVPDSLRVTPASPQPDESPEKTYLWNADVEFTAHSILMNDSPAIRQRNITHELEADTESSKPNSEADPEDRITAEVKLFELQDNKSGQNSVKETSRAPSPKQENPTLEPPVILEPKNESPLPPKIDPLTLPTPRVTGAFIETPAPTTRKTRRPRSSSLTGLPSENSTTFDLTPELPKDTKSTTTKTAQATLKSRLPFQRKPLINTAVLASAAEDIRKLQLEGQYEDCTLEELDKLLDVTDLDIKKEEEEDIDLYDETGRRLTLKEKDRRLEELAMERMDHKLKKTTHSIRDAKQGIERIEEKVLDSSSWTPISSTKPRGSTPSTVYLQIPAPRLWHHLESTDSKGWLHRKWRFTYLGIFLFTFLTWYLAETVMCEIFCHPLEATHNNWSVSDPFFPWAIPTKIDQWTGRVVSRWLGYREVWLW
ncbi:hypothetical protein HYALB_00003190 [Hymenoscyphus albidus]|uniref:Uncharacterized protein n=1 Tax=Hymenoscyphus albidus TaxID=595503 RepID=A0A9N9LFM3_9HELO|nr:hypothetical protein HYALB_00003190 [Hymenoscyphus albidus]